MRSFRIRAPFPGVRDAKFSIFRLALVLLGGHFATVSFCAVLDTALVTALQTSAILDAAVQRTKRRRIRLSYAVNKKVGSILVITISFANNKVGGILVITISFALLESYVFR